MSWMAWATGSPAIRPARVRPMSMPEETPAAVTYLPSNTTRSVTGVAPSCPSSSMASQCVVARRAVDVASRRHAHLGREGPGELPRGQAGLAGQRLHRQVRAGMVGDPPLYLTERLPVSQLPGELGAELGLVTRPPQEHHQMPGDVQGRVAAEVVFYQGQREVDPGGDARRGGDVPVPDEDRVLL